MYVVMAGSVLVTDEPVPEKEAVSIARQYAASGNETRVYKLVETHYYAANFHQKAPM